MRSLGEVTRIGIGYILYSILLYQFLSASMFTRCSSNATNPVPDLLTLLSCDSYSNSNASAMTADHSIFSATLSNIALMSLFFVQHSIMARMRVQRWISGNLGMVIERILFLLTSGLVMRTVTTRFQLMGNKIMIWDFTSFPFVCKLIDICFLLTLLGITATVALSAQHDKFRFFKALTGKEEPRIPEFIPFLHRFVRHPLFFFSLLSFWLSPIMYLGQFEFALMMTVYTSVALHLQERSTPRSQEYHRYKRKVPALIPRSTPGPMTIEPSKS